jgi:mannose-6-phosphate isomerase-like protein (cupin superfamily)
MADDFQHVRSVDADVLAGAGADQKSVQRLLHKDEGHGSVTVISTPPGSGSARGMHTHDHDQIYYILRGVMMIEVGGRTTEVGPGNLIVFRAGEEHRNWNEGSEPTLHLSIGAS